MIVSYKYRAYPGSVAETRLNTAFGTCRWLYNKLLDRIKKLQQSVARKNRFSKNRKKAKSRLNKAYEHIFNQKNDFLHKLSRRYVNTYAAVCVENLDIKGLKEKGNRKGLHRSIHSVSWGKFFSYLSYKAESAGTKLVTVNPRNTSQMCSNCGNIVKKTLSVRVTNAPIADLLLIGITMRR